jgi:hypothetical protein
MRLTADAPFGLHRRVRATPIVAKSATAELLPWLGGLGRTIEKVHNARPQTVLGTDDQ